MLSLKRKRESKKLLLKMIRNVRMLRGNNFMKRLQRHRMLRKIEGKIGARIQEMKGRMTEMRGIRINIKIYPKN
jgi:hypothetical protein